MYTSFQNFGVVYRDKPVDTEVKRQERRKEWRGRCHPSAHSASGMNHRWCVHRYFLLQLVSGHTRYFATPTLNEPVSK